MGFLFYSKRHQLAKEFEKWCKENNTDSKDITNVITWLDMNNLLDFNEVKKFLEELKGEQENGK